MDNLDVIRLILGIGFRPMWHMKYDVWEGVDRSKVKVCLSDKLPISLSKQPYWAYYDKVGYVDSITKFNIRTYGKVFADSVDNKLKTIICRREIGLVACKCPDSRYRRF